MGGMGSSRMVKDAQEIRSSMVHMTMTRSARTIVGLLTLLDAYDIAYRAAVGDDEEDEDEEDAG